MNKSMQYLNKSKQGYTSAGTSINAHRLPRVYRYEIPRGAVVLDYGCGRYPAHLMDNAAARGLVWYGYDPYNRTPEDNAAAVNLMSGTGADYVICANVLNVIDAPAAVDAVITAAVNAARVAAVFTVYEGDRTGHGRATGEDTYQRNEKRGAYVERARALGYDATARGEFIVITGRHAATA